MPRSKDPQLAVLTYFDTASVADVQSTLRFATFLVKRRVAAAGDAVAAAAVPPTKGTPRKPRKPRKTGIAPDGSAVHPPAGL